jgi:DNA-directed RNA polymerase subunit RPC12/RpoP
MVKKLSKETYKCSRCGKGYPINYEKHPNRNEVSCPFCGQVASQKVVNLRWKPNINWLKGRKLSMPFTIDEMRRQINKNSTKPIEDTTNLKKDFIITDKHRHTHKVN